MSCSGASRPSCLVAVSHSHLGSAGSHSPRVLWGPLSLSSLYSALSNWHHMPSRECQGKYGINSIVLCCGCILRFLKHSWTPVQGKAILTAVNQVSERWSRWMFDECCPWKSIFRQCGWLGLSLTFPLSSSKRVRDTRSPSPAGSPGYFTCLQRGSPKVQGLFELLLFLLARASQGQFGREVLKGTGMWFGMIWGSLL